MTADRHDQEIGERALRLAVLHLPHLAGLARCVRLVPEPRHPTAGVFASGRIVYNPKFLGGLLPADAAYVMAHELMHLALRTHRRGQGTAHRAVNTAHDYIINDMLTEIFGRPAPAGGLEMPGARHLSLEHLLAQLRSQGGTPGAGRSSSPRSRPLHGGLDRAETLPEPKLPDLAGDALDDALEREWFPEVTTAEQRRQGEAIEQQGAKAVSLGALGEALAGQGAPGGSDEPPSGVMTSLLRGLYRTPWEAALQRWLEFVAPAERTFARPSRRGADRSDLVLPGRNRVGWTLNIVLDTSGSMVDELPRALGAIASFCESVGIWQVRLLQCDTAVTADEFIEPERLTDYAIRGLGGSDMSPALRLLAEDPEIEAVIVLTDGDIDYPAEPPPYQLLWAILTDNEDSVSFAPPYGLVVPVPVRHL